MSAFFDLVPVAGFFVVYKYTDDIYQATGFAIVATLIFTVFDYFKTKKLSKMKLFSLGLIVLLGGATILFENPEVSKGFLKSV